MVRSEHAALNTLLQSAGALICKKWVELIDNEIRTRGIDAEIVAWVHDEVQVRTRKGYEDVICDIARRSAEKLESISNSRVPIDRRIRGRI